MPGHNRGRILVYLVDRVEGRRDEVAPSPYAGGHTSHPAHETVMGALVKTGMTPSSAAAVAGCLSMSVKGVSAVHL